MEGAGILASLVLLACWIVGLAIVFGVLIWALRTMWTGAPPIVEKGLMVLGVLLVLYLVLAWLAGLPTPGPHLRR